MPKPRGGARPNTGPKKGSKHKATLQKEAEQAHAEVVKAAARDVLLRRVAEEMAPMVDAQVSAAKGLRYLVTRDKKSGKFVVVTEAMARQKDGSEEETIEVWEKFPNVQAFVALTSQAIDKPKEQEQAVKISGKLLVAWGGDGD